MMSISSTITILGVAANKDFHILSAFIVGQHCQKIDIINIEEMNMGYIKKKTFRLKTY